MAGSGPNFAQTKKVIIETATTIGTKYFAILSANFCIGALERLAELTICTICESKVSEPIFSAIITKDLFPLIVPAITSSAFIQWNGFTRNHRFVDSGFPSVIFRQQEFFHLALREANHPYIMNRNNFIASFND
jgi:hypothetical protein